MSLESRIEAGGRRVLRSPLWTGLVVTLFFVVPTLLIPAVPLWVSAVTFVTIGPPTVVAFYLLYGIYGWLFGSEEKPTTEATEDITDDIETSVDRLKYRYAHGEIDESTFEQRLDQLIETDELRRQLTQREQVETEQQLRNG